MFRIHAAILFCATVLVVTGCGGNDNARVYPVSGTISFDGEPMAGGGSIAFIPIGDGPTKKGKSPGGTIDEGGSYVLSTYKEGDGSMTGEFRVIITQETSHEPEATPDGTAPAVSNKKMVPEKLIIPAIYSDPAKSPLKTKVEAKTQTLDFELKRMTDAPASSPANTGA